MQLLSNGLREGKTLSIIDVAQSPKGISMIKRRRQRNGEENMFYRELPMIN